MSASQKSEWRARLASTGLVLVIAVLPLAGCAEVEEEEVAGYVPAKLEPVKGNDDLKRVTFTAEGARRVGLRTAQVREDGQERVVPYAALIYSPQGKPYVYTSPKPLSYLPREVEVDRIEGDRVLLSDGPPAGTEIVTVGAAEVHGTELEIAAG